MPQNTANADQLDSVLWSLGSMAGKAIGLESPVLLSVSGRTRLCQLLLVRCWDQQSRRHYSRGSQPCYWRLPSYRVRPQPCSNTSGPIKVFVITWKTTCMSAVSNWSKQESSSPGAVLAIPVLDQWFSTTFLEPSQHVSLIKHTWFQKLKWVCQTEKTCKICIVGMASRKWLGTAALEGAFHFITSHFRLVLKYLLLLVLLISNVLWEVELKLELRD